MQKNYAFTGYVRKDSLYMDIVFPELNNQVIGNLTLEGYPTGTRKSRWYTDGKALYLTDIAGGHKTLCCFMQKPTA